VDKSWSSLILTYLVILVTMVYGPIAAMLVELFPTRIRYTSMSLPYHIGNGWFGGLLPTTAFAIVAQTGNMYNGLWYPIIIAAATFVIGTLFVKETRTWTSTPRTDARSLHEAPSPARALCQEIIIPHQETHHVEDCHRFHRVRRPRAVRHHEGGDNIDMGGEKHGARSGACPWHRLRRPPRRRLPPSSEPRAFLKPASAAAPASQPSNSGSKPLMRWAAWAWQCWLATCWKISLRASHKSLAVRAVFSRSRRRSHGGALAVASAARRCRSRSAATLLFGRRPTRPALAATGWTGTGSQASMACSRAAFNGRNRPSRSTIDRSAKSSPVRSAVAVAHFQPAQVEPLHRLSSAAC
jgi:hypothetical protein